MAAGICRGAHDIEQTLTMSPFTMCETSFGQDVSELVFGVNKFDLDFGFLVDSAKQPTKSNNVNS